MRGDRSSSSPALPACQRGRHLVQAGCVPRSPPRPVPVPRPSFKFRTMMASSGLPPRASTADHPIVGGLSRSPRDFRGMFGNSGSTPDDVGPGSYALPDKELLPSHTGFLTSSTRPRTVSTTPGPGSYMVQRPQPTSVEGSNVFRTKVARFCPTAPGSTVFRASSVTENPGPGRYNVRNTNTPTGNVAMHLPSTAPGQGHVTQNAPAIPRKTQSYGYEEDTGGQLKRQAAPEGGYTGLHLPSGDRSKVRWRKARGSSACCKAGRV